MLHATLVRADVCRSLWLAVLRRYLFAILNRPIGPTEPGFVLDFANRLWGDVYYNSEDRKFTRKASDPEAVRSFVHFILSPLYKLYSQVLSEDTETLKDTLFGLGISLKPIMYKMDVRPLLKAVLDQFFGPSVGLVDMIVEHIPSPQAAAATKVARIHFLPVYH